VQAVSVDRAHVAYYVSCCRTKDYSALKDTCDIAERDLYVVVFAHSLQTHFTATVPTGLQIALYNTTGADSIFSADSHCNTPIQRAD